MNKKILFASAFALLLNASAYAQTPLLPASGNKWDASIGLLLKKAATTNTNTVTTLGMNVDLSEVDVLIECSDCEKVIATLQKDGFEAEAVSENLVVAQISVSEIKKLTEMNEVECINQARQHSVSMTEAREMTGVDRIHAGEELETPFTGKGVIIGVIDQGFEFKHIAFLDDAGQPRTRIVWNHQRISGKPTTSNPGGGDGLASGHATHVTNIAAGSRIPENNYYGMAPDAELIMVSSNFTDNNVLQEAKYIKDFANEEGKPWVINMSFGSQLGPHDGTTSYDQTMSSYVEPGGFLVTAMGNEGADNLHVEYTFTSDDDKKYVLFSPSDNQVIYVDLWGTAADGAKHLNVAPVVYKSKSDLSYENDAFWAGCSDITAEINRYNQKEHYRFYVYADRLAMKAGSTAQFALEITGKAGESFHLWVNPEMGKITTPTGIGSTAYLKGDSDYCVAEGSACIPNAIGVGAYTAATEWITPTGRQQWFTGYRTKGAICAFSSRGPHLNPSINRPTICAPGTAIKSAISSYSSGFDPSSSSIVSIVTRTGIRETKYYYSAMLGTSMATPAVTGILALWLQANPQLTRENVEDIFRRTAIRDNFTGSEEWNATSGYGKIDAYAGLKEALRLANNTPDGINEMLNSQSPVTLSKSAEAWKILFNNNESYADIALYTLDGTQVDRKQMKDVKRGDETILNLNEYTPGVYLIRINTTAGSLTRKLLVR